MCPESVRSTPVQSNADFTSDVRTPGLAAVATMSSSSFKGDRHVLESYVLSYIFFTGLSPKHSAVVTLLIYSTVGCSSSFFRYITTFLAGLWKVLGGLRSRSFI